VKQYRNYIAGSWVNADSGKTFEDRNPARWAEVIGTFPDSSAADVDRGVRAAKEAFDSWRLLPAPGRGEIVRKAGDLMMARKEEIAREMTREMGKVLEEARGDVQEGIDTAYYAASEGRRLFGVVAPSELSNKFNMAVRMPVGICGLITPWNFPMAIPTWKIFPALVAGNTIVFKPAEDTPKTATTLVELLVEAGLPPGVLNLVHGSGPGAGAPLVEHPGVDLICFTGSTEVGRKIAEACGRNGKRVALEMGGKNAQIVMDDANLELALEGVLWGAFGTTGQRCTATSRLIVHEAVHDKFVKMLIEKSKTLRIGEGSDETKEVGPLINEQQLRTVERYVKIGKSEGAEVRLGGDRESSDGREAGWFFKPTILSGVEPGMRVAKEEIFGPVLAILKVNTLEEAISIANQTEYGLSSSIYTQDINNAYRAIRDIRAGITYVNAPTIGAEAHMPFGGVKQTGNGHREGGWTAFDIFTEWKAVYVDYSGKLQRAQIDAV
jgi:alpha-ketoglutaric semialdehyde dehydrogenase